MLLKNPLLQKTIAILLIFSLLPSCRTHFYHLKEKHRYKVSESNIYRTIPAMHVLVHMGENYWELRGVQINDNTLEGQLTKVDPYIDQYYQVAKINANVKVTNEYYRHYAYQLHLFVEEMKIENEQASIPLDEVIKVETLDENEGLRALMVTGTTIGALVGGLALFIVIACNCPHVYSKDGDQYVFSNTLFTGAVAKNLERDDYAVMAENDSKSDSYELIVKNEDQEWQYTNLLELFVVHHDSNVEILPDQRGNLYSISKPISPIRVTDNTGLNLEYVLAANDNVSFHFDGELDDNFTHLNATFNNPKNGLDPKLVLTMKNSAWGSYVYNEFIQLFGHKYDEFVKKNSKRSYEEAFANMKKAGITLTVQIKNDNKWIDVEDINLIGDVRYNELVVPLDPELLNENEIEIRLKSGFMFWEIDYLAIDFTKQSELDIQVIKPTVVEGMIENPASLLEDDDRYMTHLEEGDSTYLRFEGLQSKAEKRTVVLHSKGYYQPQTELEGDPQWRKLRSMTVNGGLSMFSKELFDKKIEFFAEKYSK